MIIYICIHMKKTGYLGIYIGDCKKSVVWGF